MKNSLILRDIVKCDITTISNSKQSIVSLKSQYSNRSVTLV